MLHPEQLRRSLLGSMQPDAHAMRGALQFATHAPSSQYGASLGQT
jgi:hypothetical protein